jgi:DNA-binding IclR family transcriptional regulator
MPRESPAVARAIALLEFLAKAPDQSFTLTELVRALGMNKATAHTLLATLSSARWVERNAAMEYALGPGLTDLGQAVLSRNRVLHAAQAAIADFAQQIEHPIALHVLDGDDMVAVGGGLGGIGRAGSRIPMRFPQGTVFAAWWSLERVDEWLAKLETPLSKAQRAQYHDVLAAIRLRGYVIALEDAKLKLQSFLENLPAATTVSELRASMSHALDLQTHAQANALGKLSEEDESRVSAISVPVFGLDEEVAAAMTALLDERIAGRDIEHIAAQMVELSRKISRQAGAVAR